VVLEDGRRREYTCHDDKAMDDTVIKHIARFTAIHADFESIIKRNWAPLLLTLAQ
jgi:hypothetical protein